MSDYSIRDAHRDTIIGLEKKIPNYILGCTTESSPENLRWMMEHCITHLEDFPIDKLSRWIGFVQGVLSLSGNLSVDDERNRTRPFFHAAYSNDGQDIPKSSSMLEGFGS